MTDITLEDIDNQEEQEGKNGSTEEFLFDVRVQSGQGQAKNIGSFTLNHTILDIKKKLMQDIEYNGKNYDKKLKKITLYNNSKICKDGDKLSVYNQYNAWELLLFIKFDTIGGAKQLLQPTVQYNFKKNPASDKRIRNVNTKFSFIKVSKKECIISKEKSKNNVYLPCSHTINSYSMFKYLRYIVNRNSWEYKIKCPKGKCQKEIPFQLASKIACLNKTEHSAFNFEFQKRQLPPLKACPSCKKLCSRPKKLSMTRLACTNCGKNFCWECSNAWIGGGFTVCGNKRCITNQINEYITEAPDVNIYGVKVPQRRGCPNCYSLIEHQEACKHMNCKNCGCDFCFVCLKQKKDNKWQCSKDCNDYKQSAVAKRQVLK